ncbi:MAG: Hsp20/alpha crystallin family protein [Candidatus Zixiibacteriota bacterium]
MTHMLCKTNRWDQDFDRWVNQLFNGSARFSGNTGEDYQPRANVVDLGDKVEITFELPGMEKGDIKVLVRDDILTVSGERKINEHVKKDGFVRSEIRSGAFSRSFTLGDAIDTQTVAADYQNGLLTVTMPKKAEAKPKEIEVKVK